MFLWQNNKIILHTVVGFGQKKHHSGVLLEKNKVVYVLLQSYDSAAAYFTSSNTDYYTPSHGAYKTRSSEVQFPTLPLALGLVLVMVEIRVGDLHDGILTLSAMRF